MTSRLRIVVLPCAVVIILLVLPAMLPSRVYAQAPDAASSDSDTPCKRKKKATLNADGSLHKPDALLDLERQHDAAPLDKAVAEALARELFDLAQYFMYCSPEPPSRKYPIAYCLYSKVLEIEPDHEQARQSRDTIASIYDSLSKPPPTCPD
jgi:hypothetical protein